MTNEEIVAKIKSGEGNKNELLLLLYNQNMILIQRFIRKYPTKLEYKEALQVAFLALYGACDRYDPEKGTFFTYYEYMYIHEISKYSAFALYIPKNVKYSLTKLRKTIETYKKETGKEPDIDYIGDKMNLSSAKVEELIAIRDMLNSVKSLEAPIIEDESLSYGDVIPDTAEPLEDSILNEIELQELKEDLSKCLNSLNNEQKLTIEDFYLCNKETALTAQKLGITDSKCRQIRQEGIRLLRKGKNKQILSKYIDRFDINLYVGGGVGSFKRTCTSSTERSAFNILEREQEIMQNLATLQKYFVT